LERTLWQQVGVKRRPETYGKMLLAMMPVLGENPHPAAAASLARHAVFADFDDVRAAAVAGLKRHPLDHYAILLLGALQSPLEASAVVHGPINCVSLHCSLYQEGATADLSLSHMLTIALDTRAATESVTRQVREGRVDPAVGGQLARGKARMVAARNELNEVANNFYDAVDRTNEEIRQRNARITAALGQLTGRDLGDEPMKWWKWWWQDYNESYNVYSRDETELPDQSEKPVYDYRTSDRIQYVLAVASGTGPDPGPAPPGGRCCFAPGTKVWTLTGRQPIEAIKVGDRVLAQDVESGELAYKPVLAVSTRPGGPWMKVSVGAEAITAAPSHPFWVPGEGWQMSKQLKAGMRLHTLSGAALVENIEKLGPVGSYAEPAYNLIVADFSSYFVGDGGVLVHDNTPRMPTAAIVPGLARREARP
jgi:hypothetical protein